MPSALENKLKNLVNIPKRLPASPLVPPSLLAKFLLPRKVKAVHTPVSAHYGPEDIGTQERGKLRESRTVEEESEPPKEPTTAEQVHAGQDVLKTGEGFQGRQANPIRGVGHGGARYKDPKKAAEERRRKPPKEPRGKWKDPNEEKASRAIGREKEKLEAARFNEWLATEEGRELGREFEIARKKARRRPGAVAEGVPFPHEYITWRQNNYPEEINEEGNIQSTAEWRAANYAKEAARGKAAKKKQTPSEEEFEEALAKAPQNVKDEVQALRDRLGFRRPKSEGGEGGRVKRDELDPDMARWLRGERFDTPEDKTALRNKLAKLVMEATGKTEEDAGKWLDERRKPKSLAGGGPLRPGEAEEPGKPTERSKLGEVPSPLRRPKQPILPNLGMDPDWPMAQWARGYEDPETGEWTPLESAPTVGTDEGTEEPMLPGMEEEAPLGEPGNEPSPIPKPAREYGQVGGLHYPAYGRISPEAAERLQHWRRPRPLGKEGTPLPEFGGGGAREQQGYLVKVPEIVRDKYGNPKFSYIIEDYIDKNGEKKQRKRKRFVDKIVPFNENNSPNRDYMRDNEKGLQEAMKSVGMEHWVDVEPPVYRAKGVDAEREPTKTISIQPAKSFFRLDPNGTASLAGATRDALYGMDPDIDVNYLPDLIFVRLRDMPTKTTVRSVTRPKMNIRMPVRGHDNYLEYCRAELDTLDNDGVGENGPIPGFKQSFLEDPYRYVLYLRKTNPNLSAEDAIQAVDSKINQYEVEEGGREERIRTGTRLSRGKNKGPENERLRRESEAAAVERRKDEIKHRRKERKARRIEALEAEVDDRIRLGDKEGAQRAYEQLQELQESKSFPQSSPKDDAAQWQHRQQQQKHQSERAQRQQNKIEARYRAELDKYREDIKRAEMQRSRLLGNR